MASLKSQKPPKHTFDLTITSARKVSKDANSMKPKTRRQNKQSKTNDDIDFEEDGVDDQASGSDYAKEHEKQGGSQKKATQVSRGRPSSTEENEPKKLVLTKRKKHQPDMLWTMIHKRDRDIFNLRRSREEQVRLKSDRVDDIGGYKERLKEAAEKTEYWKSMYDSEKHKNRQSKEEIKELKGEVDSKEVAVVGMQEERLGLLQRSDVPAQDDGELGQKLSSLFQASRSWVKDWGVISWSDTDSDTAQQVEKALSYGHLESPASDRARFAILKGHVPPRVLLLTITNHELCQKTFVDPLAVLRAGGKGVDHDDHTNETLVLLKDRSPAAAERIRALMLLARTVQPPGDQDDPALYDLSALEDRIQSLIAHTMRRLGKRCAALLRKMPADNMRTCQDQLHVIVRSFVEASVRINAQNPATMTTFRRNLLRCKFTLKNRYFKAHRALKLQEDDDDDLPNAQDAGLEGRPLDLVVEPGVLKVGDRDGVSYDQQKVLLKAVVWMVRDQDLSSKSMFDSVRTAQGGQAVDASTSILRSAITPTETNQRQSLPSSSAAPAADKPIEQGSVSSGGVDDTAPSMCTRNKKRLSQANNSPNKKRCTSAPTDESRCACPSDQEPTASDVSQSEATSRDRDDVPKGQKDISMQSKTVTVEEDDAVTSADISPVSQGVQTCAKGHKHCLSHCK